MTPNEINHLINKANDEAFDVLVFAYFNNSQDAQIIEVLNHYLQDSQYVKRFVELCSQEQLVYEISVAETATVHPPAQFENSKTSRVADLLSWHELAEYEKIAPTVQIPPEKPEKKLIQEVVYPPREKQKISNFSIAALVLSAAAILLLGLFVYFVPAPKPKYLEVETLEVATLVDSVDACWANVSKPMTIGSQLDRSDGARWLRGGYVKLLFGNGAEVVVESPARFEILSGHEMNLMEGRVYAKVPERAIGFSVYTPSSQVIDLGTEFGVQVQEEKSEIHVVKGKTSLIALGNHKTHRATELMAGSAKRIDQNGQSQTIKLKQSVFVQDISSRKRLIYRDEKAIEVGHWQTHLPVSLPDDIQTNGKMIQAVNLGDDAMPAIFGGIHFDLPDGNIEASADVTDPERSSDEADTAVPMELLGSNLMITDQKPWLRIWLNQLQPGRTYRLQFIIKFDFDWCHINLYGANGEYLYFPDPEGLGYGIASFTWKPRSPEQFVELTSPSDSANIVRIFGYVLHEGI